MFEENSVVNLCTRKDWPCVKVLCVCVFVCVFVGGMGGGLHSVTENDVRLIFFCTYNTGG